MKPGPKKGYKQTPEHAAKRIRRGPQNHQWKGDRAARGTGHCRAIRLYPDIGPCSKCGDSKSERHHLDDNTLNNDPSNIAILCRRCHMLSDGRIPAKKDCRVTGCGKPSNKLGWCLMHYTYARSRKLPPTSNLPLVPSRKPFSEWRFTTSRERSSAGKWL